MEKDDDAAKEAKDGFPCTTRRERKEIIKGKEKVEGGG